MIIVYIIGYLAIGLMVFCLEKKLDTYYRLSLYQKFTNGYEEGSSDKPFWSSNNRALDEYHKRTQWLPNTVESITKKKTRVVIYVMVIIELILWPIIAIASPVYNTIIYKLICKEMGS